MQHAPLKTAAFSIALLFGTATAATAQSASLAPETGAYVNLGVDALEFDAFGVSGKVGYNFNRFLGVEGQLGLGIIDDSGDVDGFDVEEGYDLFGGAFAVGRVPVTPEIDVFGRVGYYAAGLSGEVEDIEFDYDVDGFAFGGGVQFNFGPNMMSGIRAEYTNLDVDNIGDLEVDGTDFDIDEESADEFGSGDLWSLSYVRRF